MSESNPQHFFNPPCLYWPCLYWLPKITHNLYDNIDKIMRDTIDRDPLLFIPRPIWKVFGKEHSDNVMIIHVSDIQNINIYLVNKYKTSYAKISYICITEDWWQDKQHCQHCDLIVATIDPSNYMIKWVSKNNQIIDRVANVLIKLGLVKWIK